MSYFDIMAGILLILAGLKGLKNGLVKELAGLAALLLGIIVAVQFSGITAGLLSGLFQSHHMNIIAFLITFIIVVLLVHIIAHLLHSLVHAIALGVFNRILGLVFGALKAGFIISIILLGLDVFGLEQTVIPPKEQERSKLYPPVRNAAPMIFDLFEQDLDDLLRPGPEEQSPATV
ncbi:MAG: CvpA family protein [Marinilabilia sp.]